MNILEQLAEHARFRVEENKKYKSLEKIKAEELSLPKGAFEFEK